MLRFAPSPTGDMHIGNLRVAIFNHIVAKQKGEKLTIRIEDTDKERNIEGKDREILDILNGFGIEYFNVIKQSDNLKFHRQMGLQLLSEKKAFSCFCSEEEISKKRELAKQNKQPYRYDGTCENLKDIDIIDNENKFVVRLKKPSQSIKFTDKIKGDFEIQPNDIDSFILLRVDKYPTYNFACAIDDMLMDISLVIRGEDHLSNTAKQIAIRDALNYDKKIEYAHLPIILNQDGKKMSKRDNASSIKWLLEEGFIPSAITNYLILIGNKTPTEIFTLDEAIEWFNIENISKAPAKFDLNKLRFLNRKHLEKLDDMILSKSLGFADNDIGKLAKLYLEESSTLKELKSKIDNIFGEKEVLKDFEDEFRLLKEEMKKLTYFDNFNDYKKELMSKTKLKGKRFFKPLRHLLTGVENGPELSQIYPLIKNYILEIVK